ncbi:MAG: hypothetical protein ABIO92_07305 [Chloroflexia bacterium]
MKQYVSTKLGRSGAITTLSVAMMFTLAACGAPDTTVQPTATTQVQVAATVTLTLEAPIAVRTELAEPPIDGTSTMEGTETIPNAVATGTAGAMEMTPTAAGPSATTTPTPASQSGQTVGAVTEIKGTLREWAIDLSQKEASAGTLRFIVTNEGQFKHNFTITDSTGEIAATPDFVKADGPNIVEIDLEPGAYIIICDLPGHAARGQKIELVVK